MPDLIPFHYDAHEIRVQLDGDGNPWWVVKDICDILEVKQPTRAMERLDDDEKRVISIHTPGGPQNVWCINEAGLYALILGSRKPETKAFKRWVTHEVLPTLRATGQYTLATHATQDPLHARTATLTYLRAHRDFLDELGMLDDRDKLMLADCARNLFAAPTTALLVAPAAHDDGFFVADRVRTLGYRLNRKQEAALLSSLAKKIVAAYRSRYAGEPTKRKRFVDGATREVNYYQTKEAAWIDAMIQAFFAGFPGINRPVILPRET
jgi:prophage antirepressor-like protein